MTPSSRRSSLRILSCADSSLPLARILLTMDRSFACLCLVFALVATFFHSGLAIKCYQCTSRRDPKCADPISGELRATECTRDAVSGTLNEITYAVRGSPGIADVFSGSTIACLKINALNNNQYQNMTVLRGCYYEKTDGRDVCTMLRSKVIDQSTLPFCETCTGDACNGSPALAVASFMVPLAAVISFVRQ